MFGRRDGWSNQQWKKFDSAQQSAANRMERRADRLEKKADKLDSKGKSGGDDLRAEASSLRDGVYALRSDGSAASGGYMADLVDGAGYIAAGGSEHGAAMSLADGKTIIVNSDNKSWNSRKDARWNVGHESLHSAGLFDMWGPNGSIAYKFGTENQRKAFRDLKGTAKDRVPRRGVRVVSLGSVELVLS